jgi:hypothetical protein
MAAKENVSQKGFAIVLLFTDILTGINSNILFSTGAIVQHLHYC